MLRHALPRCKAGAPCCATFCRVATRAHRPSRRAGRTSRAGATPQTRAAGTPAPACACEYSRVPSHPEPGYSGARGALASHAVRALGVGFLLPIWQVHYLGPVLDARLAEDTKDLLKLVSLHNDTMPPHRPSKSHIGRVNPTSAESPIARPLRPGIQAKWERRGLSGRGLRGRGLSGRGLSGTWKAVLPCRGLASVPQNNGFELISSARMHPGQPRDIQRRTVTMTSGGVC